jgi:hypothetical protein
MNEGPSRWDEVLGSMPEATLAVRRAAFHQLLSGRSADIETVADEAGLSTEAAREAVDLVVSVGMAEVDDGTIVGDGRAHDAKDTSRPDPRRRRVVDVVRLRHRWDRGGAWGRGGGRTQCGACGRSIEVVIRGGGPEGTAVGWLPDESCANVIAEFCPSALLFCSQAHLDEWRAGRDTTSGAALDIEALADRGRSFWHQLVR